jgi:hypothetical protein
MKTNIARNVYPGATPIRLIEIAVTEGAKMTKYLILNFSAIIPIKGFSNEGIR